MSGNGQPSVNWNTTDSPYAAELTVAVTEMNNEMGIEGSNAQAVSDMSLGAAQNVQAGDNELTSAADAMSALTGEDLTHAQAQFQALQTQVSVNNEDYSAVTTDGSNQIANMVKAIDQLPALAQVANDNADNTNQNISKFGS